MSNLVQMGATLPASRNLAALSRVEEFIRTQTPQAHVQTEHVIHGGMYARTVACAGNAICGCLYKVPTMLVVNGAAKVYVGEGWTELSGYNVIAASAGT
jgi:hypothetical protein